MSNEQRIANAKRPIEAYNNKDWEAVKNSMTADCYYDELATHRKAEGADAIVELWQGWAAAQPDSYGTFENVHVIEGGVVFELTWRGTMTGTLQSPDGEIPPTGKSMEVRACQVTELEGDKAKAIRHYFDLATMMQQLGLA